MNATRGFGEARGFPQTDRSVCAYLEDLPLTWGVTGINSGFLNEGQRVVVRLLCALCEMCLTDRHLVNKTTLVTLPSTNE